MDRQISKIIFWPGIFLLLITAGCAAPDNVPVLHSHSSDSLAVLDLLAKGDSVYGRRSEMADISESMLYFDSAHRVATRLNDTILLAGTLASIGNVYNAWNREPDTTIYYYQHALQLLDKIPGKKVRAYYLRYILAHAHDGEKGRDTAMCIQILQEAFEGLAEIHDTTRKKMMFLPDFAWVATNVAQYPLAEKFLTHYVPRSSIFNDPESNNYLDHYFLTRARIDVLGKGRKQTTYLDSLASALHHCNNRFDSAYLADNLSLLYEMAGKSNKALYFSRLSKTISEKIGKNDILSALRRELLEGNIKAEREKQRRIKSELKNRDMLILFSAIAILLTALLVYFFGKRKRTLIEHARQRDFTRRMFQKGEEIRRHIASELHDGINHELLVLKNNILLKKEAEADDVEKIIASVREVSRDLYPAMFEAVGLQASVQSLCKRITDAGFFTTCEIETTHAINKFEEIQLYRIIQEALNNVTKHAKAEAAKVTIKTEHQQLIMEIEDNGRGFDASQTTIARTTYGLESMQQRAKTMGAQLHIHSGPGGTLVRLTKKI